MCSHLHFSSWIGSWLLFFSFQILIFRISHICYCHEIRKNRNILMIVERHYFLPCDLDHGVWPIFLKTLTLLITFEQWVLELWYFTRIFPVIRPFRGYHYFDPVTLTLEFDPFFENFNLAIHFWTVSARAFILYMSISRNKIFLLVSIYLSLWPLPSLELAIF